MSENKVQVYSYRWIVLLVFMFTNITMQILWITFAPVTIGAMAFYNVDEFSIVSLSLIFMIVYIPVTFLSSWLVEKVDFRWGAGIGALLGGIFGFLRFFAGTDYTLLLIFEILIAIGQPFLLNSITKLSANWFPDTERTTATGLCLISQFIGILLGFLITPFLVFGNDLSIMLLVYGIVALISGALFIIFAKARPPTPPSDITSSETVFMWEGLKKLFTNKYFLILVVLFFVGLGAFNMISTYIQLIISPRGYTEEDAGILGALMLLGGIIGAILMSTISDKFRKKKPLLLISIFITLTSLCVLSFTSNLFLLDLFGFLFGFGVLSAGPVALEYAAEITRPVPEVSSNGMLMMVGQIGGILFIITMISPTGDYFPALLLLAILTFIIFVLSFFLKEAKMNNL